MEPRCTRRLGEINDTHIVSAADPVLMAPQSIKRALEQIGSYITLDTFCSTECDRNAYGPASKAAKRKIDEETARKDQDIKLQPK